MQAPVVVVGGTVVVVGGTVVVVGGTVDVRVTIDVVATEVVLGTQTPHDT